jgi:putative transposase
MIRVQPHLTREQLHQRIVHEHRANVRDRLRAVLWVLDGQTPASIAPRLGRRERWVWTWLARYNAQGPGGLEPRPGQGRHHCLDPEGEHKLRELVEQRAADPKRARRLSGREVVEFAQSQLGVTMSLPTAYNTLHRLGYELLRPRPATKRTIPRKWRSGSKKTPPFCPGGAQNPPRRNR